MSIINAIFRLQNLSSGTIKIDDTDIATHHLKSYRETLSVIPQYPILFLGMLMPY